MLFDPNEAVTGAIRTVFEKFAELGSARQVWLSMKSEGLLFPTRTHSLAEIRWGEPTYTAIHHTLTNPAYAGAYAYGKTRQERYVDEAGQLRKRLRRLPRSEWAVLIPEHHEGFIDWSTYEMNQKRLSDNIRPRRGEAGGAVREGCALLQGVATCGRCGRRLKVAYSGRNNTASYYCSNSHVENSQATRCLHVGGVRIDRAVSSAFVDAVAPAGMEAALRAEELIETQRENMVAQWRLQLEQARYHAERAERRYRRIEPENRLVARTLEGEWEDRLSELAVAEAELAQREQQRPDGLTDEQRERIRLLGLDLNRVWDAPTTTDRDRKELLRSLLEEVQITVERAESQAHLLLRWRGGTITEIDVALHHPSDTVVRTDEDTIDLVRRLAEHYPDGVIAGILGRQGRKTAYGLAFTANRVGNIRRQWEIPRFQPPKSLPEGDLVSVEEAARILGLVPSTIHRWLNEGFIAGEQITPGAPWRIRMDEDLKQRFVESTPQGYVPMIEATRILGVTRQTVLQRVKRGELEAVHVTQGRRKGLRIKVIDNQPSLFEQASSEGV